MPSSPIARRHHRTLSSISSLPPFLPQRTSRPSSRLALLVFLAAALALTTYLAHAKGGMDLLRLAVVTEEPVRPREGLGGEAVMEPSPALEAAQDPREDGQLAGMAIEEAVGKPARRPKAEHLPVCKKSVLFRFAGRHGFGSEVSLLFRVASVAHHFGYTVFLDSTSWNYGSWDSYFSLPSSPSVPPYPSTPFAPLDPAAPCRPPSPTTKRYKMSLTDDESRALSLESLGSSFRPKWANRNHVYWLRDVDGLDATFLRLFVDEAKLAQVHREDLRHLEAVEAGEDDKSAFLSATETLPSMFEDAFGRMSELVRDAWAPNEEVRRMVGELERELGVSGKERREGKRPGDLLVGVHVRLGDKFLEADRIGPASLSDPSSAPPVPADYSTPGLTDELLTSYYAAAVDSINSLLSLPTSLPSPFSHVLRTNADRIRALFALSAPWSRLAAAEGEGQEDAKPTLALMSDDPNAVEAFRAHPMARRFRIVGTAQVEPSPSSAERARKRARREVRQEVMEKRRPDFAAGVGAGVPHAGTAHVGAGGGAGHGRTHAVPKTKQKVPDGFNETAFNRLPLATRIASARIFVRDLTVLSSRADALIVTGSSNVGRLMMLLFEARRREEGEGGKREVRSLDTRWFPTARFA
ncbi:hypothetical protein Rt10032_c05g2240 [Rhodotorula toruloides]|uniref:Uncharacterized protein n=1 Tax=Rhodotorula toruloides TaxID=5286 RepID=A0A511KCX8_RHOTO|nr:hypothetical protein Rt10032_c05g2240 [Rhodotorula toruloides]